MKKAIDQTVRDLKRGVNKKVLKVPGIEQKVKVYHEIKSVTKEDKEEPVLDATSNEPWGPHGSLLADIAIATTNYHEYQLIIAVIWRRIADTGKNWRHVYKALVLLEYLVAHGSERVIDEIKEHSYQISMLSDFQYMDSSGRDQGSNVRRKSQSLVILVNDKAKVYDARQKAAANKDKLRNSSASGVYRTSSRTSSGGYGDKYDYDRYEDRNGDAYSREREFGIRDEVQYKNRLSYSSADGDSYSSQSYTDDNYGSSRGSGAKVEDYIQDERVLDRRYSGRSMGVPPCSEEAVGETQSAHSKRTEETSAAPGPTTSSGSNNHNLLTAAAGGETTSPRHQNTETSASANQDSPTETASGTDSASNAAPAILSNAEMDLLSILQDSFPSNSLAITPTTSAAASGAADVNADPTASQSASSMGFDDPFGDGPFKAIMTDATPVGDQKVQNARLQHPVSDQPEEITNLEFQGSFPTVASPSPGVSYTLPTLTPSQSLPQEHSPPGQEDDILAGILPPVGSLDIAASQAALASPPGQPAEQTSNPYNQPSHQTSNPYSQPAQISAPGNSQPASPGGNVYGQPGLPSTNLYGQLAQPNANMFWQQTQSSSNPYAYLPSSTTNQYNQHIQSASYFHPSQHTVSPYSYSQSLGNQHGQPRPQPTANGYGQSQTPANSYGQPPQPTANPYSQSQLSVNPYGYPQPAGNPYGHQLHASPYSQHRLPAADPFSNLRLPSSNPYGQPSPSTSGNMYGGLNPQSRHMALPAPNTAPTMASGPASQSCGGRYSPQGASASVVSSQATEPHSPARQALQLSGGNFVSQQPSAAPTRPQSTHQGASASLTSSTTNVPGNFLSQADEIASKTPQAVPQLKEKFEPKSAVWADTLSRGLVNFNISGPKTNPLSDIGIDFDAMNRKEKRTEKPAASQVTSTVTMGKAMGSGSGMGRAGASTLQPPPNSMIGPRMGMGMGMAPGTGTGMGMGMVGGPGAAMSMGGYQQPTGMGLNMAQGVNFQPQVGMCAGSIMPGGYGPMMGSSGYAPQQPYGGNYR